MEEESDKSSSEFKKNLPAASTYKYGYFRQYIAPFLVILVFS
jgi:hypothetical protein